MIIVRVPFRISLFGGGTDFKAFYSKHGAKIVSFSIDKYCYITVRRLLPYFNTDYRVSWSRIEEVNSIQDISHPSIRACLKYMKVQSGLEIHTVGDLPARSGLGSSSAFTAGLLSSLYIYQNKQHTVQQIVRDTIYVEQVALQETVGIQDQIQVCHGGFNITTIYKDSSYSMLTLNQTSPLLPFIDSHLVLVYSGIARNSSSVHNSSTGNSQSSSDASRNELFQIAQSISNRLQQHQLDIPLFIDSLNQSWAVKSISLEPSETTDTLLDIYSKAISSGALTGKLLGAGGGGFFAFFVPPALHNDFMKKMSPHICTTASISATGIERIL